jgi:hypothetical protein
MPRTEQQSRFRRDWVKLLALCLAPLLGLAGCSWTDTGGTHHLIVGVGFGIITTTNCPGVDVCDTHILGGEFGPHFVGIGWLRHHQVDIDPPNASNVVVSVKAGHMGITVKNFDPYSINTNLNQTTKKP